MAAEIFLVLLSNTDRKLSLLHPYHGNAREGVGDLLPNSNGGGGRYAGRGRELSLRPWTDLDLVLILYANR